jgi:hypothetical protein
MIPVLPFCLFLLHGRISPASSVAPPAASRQQDNFKFTSANPAGFSVATTRHPACPESRRDRRASQFEARSGGIPLLFSVPLTSTCHPPCSGGHLQVAATSPLSSRPERRRLSADAQWRDPGNQPSAPSTLNPSAPLDLVSVTSTPLPQQPPTYRVAGIIVDASTNAPIPHAELSITNTDNADDAQTFSTSDGHFVFQNVPPGKYPLSAFAPGYIHEGFNQHGSLLTAIAVGTGTDSEHIVFRLHRQAILTGHVTDERGEPVRHAQVLLFASETPSGHPTTSFRFTTETNDLGEYRFAALPSGKYFVTVTAHPWYAQSRFIYASELPNGVMVTGLTGRRFGSAMAPNIQQNGDPSLDVVYPFTFYPNVTDPHAASELTLSPGDKFDANIQLQPVPAIHLHITNLSAEPMSLPQASASQKLFGSSGYSVSVVASQIAPGELEVTGFAPGELSLEVGQSINGTWLSHSFEAHIDSNETLDAAGSTATANVSGRVLLGGADIMSGGVNLQSDSGQRAAVPLQKDGSFSFGPLQEGTYRVSINLQERGGDFDYFVDSLSATGAKTSDKELTISTTGDVQLTVNVARGFAQVTGVANLDGKPIAGAMVLLVPASGKSLEEDSRVDQSDSDGTFTLSHIRPDKYLALALDNAWDLDRTNWSALTPYLPKAQQLDLAPAAQQKLTLTVQPATAQPTTPQVSPPAATNPQQASPTLATPAP